MNMASSVAVPTGGFLQRGGGGIDYLYMLQHGYICQGTELKHDHPPAVGQTIQEPFGTFPPQASWERWSQPVPPPPLPPLRCGGGDGGCLAQNGYETL